MNSPVTASNSNFIEEQYPVFPLDQFLERDATYLEIISAAKSFLARFSDTLEGKVWGRIKSGSLPSAWKSQKEWSIRTGLAAAISMTFALYYATYPSIFSANEVLAPIIAIVAVQKSLGETLQVSVNVMRGCVLGSLFALFATLVIRHTTLSPTLRDSFGGLSFFIISLFLTTVRNLP